MPYSLQYAQHKKNKATMVKSPLLLRSTALAAVVALSETTTYAFTSPRLAQVTTNM